MSIASDFFPKLSQNLTLEIFLNQKNLKKKKKCPNWRREGCPQQLEKFQSSH